IGLSRSTSNSTSMSLSARSSPRATDPNIAAWLTPIACSSFSCARRVWRTTLSLASIAVISLPPAAPLHGRQRCKAQRNYKAHHNLEQTRAPNQVIERQKQDAHTDAQIPPGPVLRLKSPHLPATRPCRLSDSP